MPVPYAQRVPHARHRIALRLGLWYALVSIVGSAALAGCSLGLPGTSATPTSSPATQLSPAWTAVLDQIGPNGEVSLATALQAYTVAFGPLPGVQPPPSASGLLPSATLAVRMILRHFQDLTSAQQQVVLQRLGYTAPASAAAPPSVTALVAAGAQAGLRVQRLDAPSAPTPVPTDGAGTASYRAMLDALVPKLNGFFGVTFSIPVVLAFDPSNKQDDAYTTCMDATGSFTGPPVLCRIYLAPIMNTYAPDSQWFVIAHELMHCYQAAIQGQVSVWSASPDWLIEGSAEWGGALASGATAETVDLRPSWVGWLAAPDHPLFSRAYSAIGFYALLDQAGISPWSVLPAMLTSQSQGKDNVAAYQAAIHAAPQEVLDEWASSYERDPSLGLDWDLHGPGIIAVSTYALDIHDVTLASDGQATAVTTPAYTAIDYDLTSQADVVQVSISGTARLIDSAHVERVTSVDGSYCTKQGGCVCPDGSAYQGPALAQLTGLVHLTLTGGPQGATGFVSGMTLQQFCSQKKKPTSVPSITVAFCQQIMTVAEANQIMNPPTPSNNIVADQGPSGGSCNYEYAPLKINLVIGFANWNGPVPVPQQAITDAIAQLAGLPGVTVTTFTTVSGVGDQAAFVAATGTKDALTMKFDVFYVLYGNVQFSCATVFFNQSAPPDATQKGELQQCAEQVVSRLDP